MYIRGNLSFALYKLENGFMQKYLLFLTIIDISGVNIEDDHRIYKRE